MHDCIEMSVLWVNSDISCVQSTLCRAVHHTCLLNRYVVPDAVAACSARLIFNKHFGVFGSLELIAHCSCTWVCIYIVTDNSAANDVDEKLLLKANMSRRLERQRSCSCFTLYLLLQLKLRQAESPWSDSQPVVLVVCHCLKWISCTVAGHHWFVPCGHILSIIRKLDLSCYCLKLALPRFDCAYYCLCTLTLTYSIIFIFF